MNQQQTKQQSVPIQLNNRSKGKKNIIGFKKHLRLAWVSLVQ